MNSFYANGLTPTAALRPLTADLTTALSAALLDATTLRHVVLLSSLVGPRKSPRADSSFLCLIPNRQASFRFLLLDALLLSTEYGLGEV